MKLTHQIAYDYAMACKTQEAAEDMVSSALSGLGSDNLLFSLSTPVKSAYTKLVYSQIGLQLADWLEWWMYETDYGSLDMEFTIDGTSYNPQDITLYKFLELVDASN